jgi:LysR family transcriptional regulator for metE and metH
MEKRGEVEVLIVPEATRRPFDALRERKVDLVLSHERPSDPGFTTRILFRDEMLLLVAPDHRLAAEAIVSVEEFRHEHLILHTSAIEESQFYLQYLAPAGIRPRRFTGVMLTEAVVEMVKAGLGLTVLPRWTAAPFLLDGTVIAKRVTRQGAYRIWHSVTRKNPAHAEALTALINDIATQMARKTNVAGQSTVPRAKARFRAAKSKVR